MKEYFFSKYWELGNKIIFPSNCKNVNSHVLDFLRYSDFHALHEKVCLKYERLAHLTFPSKKTFGNMERHVLETRRKMLDLYLKALLEPATLESNLGLIILMHRFLDQVICRLSL